jgi:hypothetical protein
MLLAHLSMPLHREPDGSTLRYGVLLTNLEPKRTLTFRLAFATSVRIVPGDAEALLNDHVSLVPNSSARWVAAGLRVAIAELYQLPERETVVVELAYQGAIDPTLTLQPLLEWGLRGTTELTLPTIGGRPQIDHPARVAASAYLRPDAPGGQRSFLPAPGGSFELLVQSDPPTLAGPFPMPQRRKSKPRARR